MVTRHAGWEGWHIAPRLPFRPDVEGLRALAIGLVLLAHARVPFAAGGFVGVDVFFVISGFLITRLLVGELDATGRLSLTRFYGRRIRRLMPQAVAVVVAVAVVSPMVLSPVRSDAVAGDVLAAASYVMNWHLSAEAVDYFATGAADGPLDHFWSLAVEEQFYLLWPLLLLGAARIPRRGGHAAVLGAVACASLVYAVLHAQAAPEQAYFSSPARAWELAFGGLAALALAHRRLNGRAASLAGWAGLAAIGVATVAYDGATPFPGLPALLPTLGAVALLAAGTAAAPTALTRWLTMRPMQSLGRLSYAWYVWHWPVLVFAEAAQGPLSTAEAIGWTGASLVPTLVTNRLIEEPIRRSRTLLRMPRATLAGAPATAIVVAACGLWLSATIDSPPVLSAERAEGAAQLSRTGVLQRSATALRPSPRDADADRGRPYYDGCLVPDRPTRSPACVYGDPESATTVVLFGDSHAMQYFPALEPIAARRRWRVVELTKAGCPPQLADVVYAPGRRAYPECRAWRDHALARIARERPILVVVAASVQYRVIERGRRLDAAASERALNAGWAPVLTRLRRTGARVAVLLDAPIPPLDVPDCVSASLDDLRPCAFPRRQAVERAKAVGVALARLDGITVIDPTSRFCLRRLCPAVIGDVIVYRNHGHVTASFAATLAPWLERRLPAVGAR